MGRSYSAYLKLFLLAFSPPLLPLSVFLCCCCLFFNDRTEDKSQRLLQGKHCEYNHLIMNFLNVQHDQEQLDRISIVCFISSCFMNTNLQNLPRGTFFSVVPLLALTMQASNIALFSLDTKLKRELSTNQTKPNLKSQRSAQC